MAENTYVIVAVVLVVTLGTWMAYNAHLIIQRLATIEVLLGKIIECLDGTERRS